MIFHKFLFSILCNNICIEGKSGAGRSMCMCVGGRWWGVWIGCTCICMKGPQTLLFTKCSHLLQFVPLILLHAAKKLFDNNIPLKPSLIILLIHSTRLAYKAFEALVRLFGPYWPECWAWTLLKAQNMTGHQQPFRWCMWQLFLAKYNCHLTQNEWYHNLNYTFYFLLVWYTKYIKQMYRGNKKSCGHKNVGWKKTVEVQNRLQWFGHTLQENISLSMHQNL